jgi:hypothetical protein
MASINTGRVILGGLVGGVVANVCDFVWNNYVLKDDMMDMAKRFGMDPAAMTSMSAAVPWMVIDFVFGFLIVWTYAAMRPRLGPGPKTAILAGLVPYIGVTAVLYGFTATMGMMPMAAFVKGSAAALVTTIFGSLAGAYFYQEA